MNARRMLVIAIGALAVLSIAFLLVNPTAGPQTGPSNGVLVVRLYGPIQETGGGLLMEGTITPQLVEEQLKRAAADPRVKAVIFRLSSPGGSVAASQEIYSMFRSFEKPIVISMGDQAASGGYYIAAAADAIVANPGTITGSIGVITAITNLDGLYEKLGVDVQIIKSGRHKDMFQRPLTTEERQLLQDLNDEAWNQFVEAVAQGRNLEIDHVRNLATGEIFTGSQGLELGLVDYLGGLDEAVRVAADLAGADELVVVEPRRPSLWQRLMSSSISLMEGLRSQSPVAQLEWIQSLEGIPDIRYEISY